MSSKQQKTNISPSEVAQMLNRFDLSLNVQLSSAEASRLAEYFDDPEPDSDDDSDTSDEPSKDGSNEGQCKRCRALKLY